MIVETIAQAGGTTPSSGGSDYGSIFAGVAAMLTAFTALVVGVRRSRRDRATIRDVQQTAMSGSANASTAAALAGAIAKQAIRKADDYAMDSGMIEELRHSISTLATRLVDMSASTAEQLRRSTDALVECERREARLMSEISLLRVEIGRLQTDLTALARSQTAFRRRDGDEGDKQP